jgi:hypothetical protein
MGSMVAAASLEEQLVVLGSHCRSVVHGCWKRFMAQHGYMDSWVTTYVTNTFDSCRKLEQDGFSERCY